MKGFSVVRIYAINYKITLPKENIESLLVALGKKLFGFEIRNPQPITEKLQTTIMLEPDFLKKASLDDEQENHSSFRIPTD